MTRRYFAIRGMRLWLRVCRVEGVIGQVLVSPIPRAGLCVRWGWGPW